MHASVSWYRLWMRVTPMSRSKGNLCAPLRPLSSGGLLSILSQHSKTKKERSTPSAESKGEKPLNGLGILGEIARQRVRENIPTPAMTNGYERPPEMRPPLQKRPPPVYEDPLRERAPTRNWQQPRVEPEPEPERVS